MTRWPMFMASVKRESKWYRSAFPSDMLERTLIMVAVVTSVILTLGGVALFMLPQKGHDFGLLLAVIGVCIMGLVFIWESGSQEPQEEEEETANLGVEGQLIPFPTRRRP